MIGLELAAAGFITSAV